MIQMLQISTTIQRHEERYPREVNGGHFHLKWLFPLSLFFPLCKAEECHIWYAQQASSPIPQSSLVPDDEQAARGHPATRSLSKHPPVLCGSDLITAPGPRCALPSLSPPLAQRPQIVISPPLPSRITPPSSPLSSSPTSPASRNPQIGSTVLRVGVLWASSTYFSLFFFFFFLTDVSADSFLSSFPSDALQGIAERKVVCIPCHRSTSAPIKQNKNVL